MATLQRQAFELRAPRSSGISKADGTSLRSSAQPVCKLLMARRKKTAAQLRGEILVHLEEFDYQLLLLEKAMEQFGENFDLREFKRAFEKQAGISASHQVQAVERSFSRVQNFIAQLAESGSMLAQLKLPKSHGGDAARAFEALREAKIIEASICNQLKRGQAMRSEIEHEYVQVKAGRVHEAAKLVAAIAPEFISRYKTWIEPYL